MELRELYCYAERQMRQRGVTSETKTTTDRSGEQNIGHTVPWYDSESPALIVDMMARGDEDGVAVKVASARCFITAGQRRLITSSSAFTIEPLIVNGGGIMATFHFIVAFRHGVKQVFAGFSNLFHQFAMQDYLSRSAVAAVRRCDEHHGWAPQGLRR